MSRGPALTPVPLNPDPSALSGVMRGLSHHNGSFPSTPRPLGSHMLGPCWHPLLFRGMSTLCSLVLRGQAWHWVSVTFPQSVFLCIPVLDDHQNPRLIKDLLQDLSSTLCILIRGVGKSVLVGNINIWICRLETILRWQQQLQNLQVTKVRDALRVTPWGSGVQERKDADPFPCWNICSQVDLGPKAL